MKILNLFISVIVINISRMITGRMEAPVYKCSKFNYFLSRSELQQRQQGVPTTVALHSAPAPLKHSKMHCITEQELLALHPVKNMFS
jgi:hypothetical protein